MKAEFNPIWIAFWKIIFSLIAVFFSQSLAAAQTLAPAASSHSLRLHRHHTKNHRATLGRVLFHDKTLSRNNLVSCASCHKQAHGFDDDKRFSIALLARLHREILWGWPMRVFPPVVNSFGINARFQCANRPWWHFLTRRKWASKKGNW